MGTHGHSVQFYHDSTFLTDSVTRFMKEGLSIDETVIIVATAQHREAFRKGLTSQEITHDKLWFLDTSEQLSIFMAHGWFNEQRFMNGIRSIIGPASKYGPIRVFGEMVAVLWANGHARTALRLEELWNELMRERVPLSPLPLPHPTRNNADPHTSFTLSFSRVMVYSQGEWWS